MAGLTIGKFAAAEGVGVETVRFYQRRGLLALPEPRASDMQKYGVVAVPTMHAFSGGRVVRQVTGARSKSALLRDFAGII